MLQLHASFRDAGVAGSNPAVPTKGIDGVAIGNPYFFEIWF
jgi:hypothetical protein